VTDGRQAWLRWRSVDSFLRAPLFFRGGWLRRCIGHALRCWQAGLDVSPRARAGCRWSHARCHGDRSSDGRLPSGVSGASHSRGILEIKPRSHRRLIQRLYSLFSSPKMDAIRTSMSVGPSVLQRKLARATMAGSENSSLSLCIHGGAWFSIGHFGPSYRGSIWPSGPRFPGGIGTASAGYSRWLTKL
jgi:hypothetical protein